MEQSLDLCFSDVNQFLQQTADGITNLFGELVAFNCVVEQSAVEKDGVVVEQTNIEKGKVVAEQADTKVRKVTDGDAFQDAAIESLEKWKNLIKDYLIKTNNSSLKTHEWLMDESRQDMVCRMLVAIEIIRQDHDIFMEGKPFLHFFPYDHFSDIQFEQDLIDLIGLAFVKTWKDKHDDDLWTQIRKNVNEALNIEDCEVFVFSDNALRADYNALSCCYWFFYEKKNHILLAMEIGTVPWDEIERIRKERGFYVPGQEEYVDEAAWFAMGYTRMG